MSNLVAESWHRFDIQRIDDLSNAVLGADLEAIQMAGRRVRGSLAFAARNGIVFSTALIDGNAMIRGTPSCNEITLGVILRSGSGSRVWLNKVSDGDVGVVLPGGECEFFCTPGSLMVSATLSPSRLRNESAREGLAVHRDLLNKSGLHSTPLRPSSLSWLKEQIVGIHKSRTTAELRQLEIGRRLLGTIVSHYADVPLIGARRLRPAGHAKIVHDACEYIRKHLASPISVEALSKKVDTSPRTLFRSFSEILGDAPQNYIRRLRLHRIRRELILSSAPTVSGAAHYWGIGQDLGRFAQSYRDLFGELPSSTLAFGRQRQRGDVWL